MLVHKVYGQARELVKNKGDQGESDLQKIKDISQ